MLPNSFCKVKITQIAKPDEKEKKIHNSFLINIQKYSIKYLQTEFNKT
jgi:hypothetical protein